MTEPLGALLGAAVPRHCPELENPHQSALALVAHVLGKPKTWVIAHSDTYLTPAQTREIEALLERLCAGEPLAYLTGKQAFFGLEFNVSPAVLIPRPETELLVESGLAWLEEHPQAHRALDIGTGSGAIAIALASKCPRLEVLAADISDQALAVAQANIARHDLQARVSTIKSDLCQAIEGQFDLLTANLPYIPSQKLLQLPGLAWEPQTALDGGEDGLTFIRRLLSQAAPLLNRPALILLETESSLGPQTAALAIAAFPHGTIELHRDLAGLDRLVSIQLTE